MSNFFDRKLYSKVLKEALLLFLENFFEFQKWTYHSLLAEQCVHETNGIQSLSIKFVEINAVCPRN